jgi:HEAT repeat protein
MNQPILLVAKTLALFVAANSVYAQAPDRIEPRDEWFRALDIEAAVAEAELILVTRIDEVKEIPMPVGGKGERAMLQIQFDPMRVLKGVFAREGLTLTSYDLGIFQSRAGLDRLKAGDLRLLFLGRSQSGYQNRNVASDVDRSLPLLQDEQDPLTATVSTMLAVRAALDRVRCVTLLTEALARTQGAAAVPLLNALPRRALLAAQQDATLAAIAPHLIDASPAVRMAAGETLRAVLAADYLEHPGFRERAANALGAALSLDRPNVAAKIALIGAAGELSPVGAGVIPPLAPDAPLAVQRAQIKALGRFGQEYAQFEPILAGLPLDHPNADAYETALARSDPEAAATLIPHRARLKLAAGLSIEDQIYSATPMTLEFAVTTLVQLAEMPLNAQERHAFAMTAGTISGKSPKHRALYPLVTPLATMLDPSEAQTRYAAIVALVNIDAPTAARALQPHLREETNLTQKLLMAEFLGRHGIRDGYPYVIEHMSEPHLLERAVAALAAIGETRAIEQSRRILETSNDEAWNGAAIRVLGAMGERNMVPRFLEIIEDWKHPLAPAALIALGDLGEPKALPAVQEGLTSRSEEIVVAAARAAGKLIKKVGNDATELRAALAVLLADSSATEPMRAAALESLVLIEDPRLNTALASAVTDAGLEDTPLLARIEELLRERKVRLAALVAQ